MKYPQELITPSVGLKQKESCVVDSKFWSYNCSQNIALRVWAFWLASPQMVLKKFLIADKSASSSSLHL